MSIRTCQLCGKPLGRMRVGGDDEFCSREHRNQFRLRRGMDRLQEANKMATLMRRRESPRQLPLGRLLASPEPLRRAVLVPAAFQIPQVRSSFPAVSPSLFESIGGRANGHFSNPLSDLLRRSALGMRRMLPADSRPFAARASAKPVLRARDASDSPVRLARAAMVRIPSGGGTAGKNPRACGAALRISRPAVAPAPRLVPPPAGRDCLEAMRRLREIDPAPRALRARPRTLPEMEFEKRAPVVRAATPRPGAGSRLDSRGRLEGALPAFRDIPASSTSCSVPLPEGVPSLPEFHPRPQPAGARQRGVIPYRRPVLDGNASAARIRELAWGDATPASSLSLRSAFHGAAGFSRRAAPRAVDAASAGADFPRAAEVKFAPADSSYDYAPIGLHGSLPATAPPPPPEPAQVRAPSAPIEEHFNSGLDNWSGETADWKLDAAGARPGGLALFRPAAGMSDYEFEFLARIESRGVTFVFRAANLSNYLKITIALAESGKYELRRCAVIGGVEETAVVVPLGGILRSGSAFTVKARARRNDFMITLDGEVVARWTDGRLPTGGIGLMAPRGDRARVYWLRLSHPGGPNSGSAPGRPARSIQ
ncbi:MAG TPA: hypothetical protein VJ732_20565 [Bryobacteraceae bacterium]|nr:hypothetical protein [Bryobacteraceae bacterium]